MNLSKISRELLRALRNHNYETTDVGSVLFAGSKVIVGGSLSVTHNGIDLGLGPNLVVTEGLNYLLEAGLHAGSVLTAWYIAPYAANVAPTGTLTAATFASTQTEFTNYSEATRQVWTVVTAAGGVLTNAASPAQVTIGAGGQVDMYGIGVISASAKSSTAGKLLAAAPFPSPRLGLQNLDVLGFRYALTMTSS